MAKRTLYACIIVVLALLVSAGPAAGFEITAKSALVMDADTGRVIISKDIHRKLPPASTTKVMAVVVALENAPMGEVYCVSKRAACRVPTKVNLLPGDEISLEALLYSMLLKSANDAATALAEGIAGTEAAYGRMMTDRAREIGARDSNFKNASGLPQKGHYSTAYDIAVIFRYAMRNDAFVDIASTKYATLNMGKKDVLLKNSNKLLWVYEGAVAGKTGYTRSARDCYVGEVEKDGTRLIVSILGSEHRWDDARTLLDKGFELAGTGRVITFEDAGRPVLKEAAYGAAEQAAAAYGGGSE